MNIKNKQELDRAVKHQEPELLVEEPVLIRRIRLLINLRLAANILVFVILAVAIIMWANPFRIPFFEGGSGRLTRTIILGIGIILVFAEYLMPVARLYKIASFDGTHLRLILRNPKGK